MDILYGVPGEGMGHATRSKVVISYLLSCGHNVQVVSSARAFKFLKETFGDRVHEIKGLHFAYKNAQVSKLGTFLLNLKHAPENLLHNFSQYLLIHHAFHPQLIISDFESFTYFFARRHKIPIISIDNMQVMNRCKLDIKIDAEEKENYQLAKAIVKAKVPGCSHYFITSFFDAPIAKENTTIVPPIIREAIQRVKPFKGKHVIMYQTSSSFAEVKQVLKQLPEITFYIYGMNRDEQDGNLVFKPFSEQGFIDDLAGATAVIANGGFSFISEAVYLQKPVYAFPIKGQFEQWMNAAYIEKLGYGRHFETLEADALKAFMYDLPLFERNLAAYKQQGNEVLFKTISGWIKQYA